MPNLGPHRAASGRKRPVRIDDLMSFERRRLAKLQKVKIVLLSAGLFILIALIFFQFSLLFWFCLALTFIVLDSFMKFFNVRDFELEFKEKIISKIITNINSTLTYSAQSYLKKAHFHDSKIFRYTADRYYGDDYISGVIDKTSFEMSEIHASYHHRGYRSGGYIVMFQGLFFVADFNKNFKGETFVFPDLAEKKMGMFGSWLQSKNQYRPELIKLEDPEFEEKFVVYGTDQVESRYVLSPALMKRMTDFVNKRGQKVFFSFRNSQIYIGVTYKKRLFKPTLFKSFLDTGVIEEYYEDLLFAVDMIEDLNLNTRIWTKS